MKHTNTVAVENDLQNVKQALKSQGYKTVDMNQSVNASCIVVSGMDQNFMGMEEVQNNVPVVIAKGKSAQEVVSDVKRFMS